MTIFGTGYQALDYRPTPMLRRLWALAWLELRALFRTRWGTVMFLICQIPLFRSLFVLTIWGGFWEFGGPGASARLARAPSAFNPEVARFYLAPALDPQGFVFVLLLTTLVSARSIAKDRGAHALEILWTRGVSPLGYFAAKWAGSFLLVGIGTVLGPLLMWVLAQATAPDEAFLQASLPFLPRVVLALAFFTAAITGLATALSALTRSANMASILWVVLMVGSTAFGRVFARLFRGETALRAASPWDACKRVAEWIAGVTPRIDFSPNVALIAVGVFVVVIGGLAARRLRIAEAVG